MSQKGWPAKVSQEIDQWPCGRRPTHHIQVTILEYLAVNQEMQNDAEAAKHADHAANTVFAK